MAEQIISALEADIPAPDSRARNAALLAAREYLESGREPPPAEALAQGETDDLWRWLSRANTAALAARIRRIREQERLTVNVDQLTT